MTLRRAIFEAFFEDAAGAGIARMMPRAHIQLYPLYLRYRVTISKTIHCNPMVLKICRCKNTAQLHLGGIFSRIDSPESHTS